MGAIRDTLLGYKHQKTENLLKTLEDKVLKNEASEKNSALSKCLRKWLSKTSDLINSVSTIMRAGISHSKMRSF